MEPGIGVRRRACRELVLSLTSARRAGQLAKDVEASEAVAEALGQEARVLQRIADQGIGQLTVWWPAYSASCQPFLRPTEPSRART
ncbi:hypothetical protein ACFYRG_28800 [Streptomyces mirabilis]|uniref:hypothetical protein n=1 Tax=Streptomyces mirabilis TaxID=68239 RepID=UPI0036CAD056